MKFFQRAQTLCQAMGIVITHSNQDYSINLKALVTILPTIIFFMCSLSFLLLEATSIENYDDSFFMTSSSVASMAVLFVVILKMPNLLKMIAHFEEKIELSKWIANFGILEFVSYFRHWKKSVLELSDDLAKTKFSKLNDRIELLSELYYFFLVKLSIPAVLLPSFLITIINCSIRDLGDESYVLPFPIVYVIRFHKRHLTNILIYYLLMWTP